METTDLSEKQARILLTNDDGIRSPGLWAAAEALSGLGFVHVVAPREQSSSLGRSLPKTSDGIIQSQEMMVNGKKWTVYAVGGTPAQAVLHAVLEVIPGKPDLLVSGINYGENVGSGVTISGTVGAALEGAALGIRSMAVSLETDLEHHYSHSEEVDFSAAAHFTTLFGRLFLQNRMPDDVDVLKVEVPCDATPETPWMVTRQSRMSYFEPVMVPRDSWDTPARVGYKQNADQQEDKPDTDVYTLRHRRLVSVTPLSLDMTSRVDLGELEKILRKE